MKAKWIVFVAILGYALVVFGHATPLCTAKVFDAQGYLEAVMVNPMCEMEAEGYK